MRRALLRVAVASLFAAATVVAWAGWRSGDAQLALESLWGLCALPR